MRTWMKSAMATLGALACCLILSGTCFAGDLFLTPKAGTLGLGADLGYQFIPSVKARLNMNGFSYETDQDLDDIEYDADLNLFSLGGLVDLHPFGKGFRVSGGVYFNDNNLDANAALKVGKTFEIGEREYTASQVRELDAEVRFNDFAPYVGIGWGTDFDPEKNWYFSFDLGAMYMGSASIDLDAETSTTLSSEQQAELQQDLDEEEQNIEDDVEDYKWYPVVAIGITYRF